MNEECIESSRATGSWVVWLLGVVLTGGMSPLLAAPPLARSKEISPFAAHNCYSDLGVKVSKYQLTNGLRAGLRFIEVDVHHVPSAGGFVVTHKSKDPPSEPLLGDFLEPLWRRWTDEPGEHLLIIDLKAGRPDQVAADMHRYLLGHRDALCTFAPDGTPRATGPVSVCLTGSQVLGQAYIDLATKKGELLARRDGGPGARNRDLLRRYLRRAPRPGVGYLTLNWGNIVRGSKTPDDYMDWLCEIVAGARRSGYRLRVYTLNVARPERVDGRLASGEWDAAWSSCVRAGVDMIATDNYGLAAEWWREIGVGLPVVRPKTQPAPASSP